MKNFKKIIIGSLLAMSANTALAANYWVDNLGASCELACSRAGLDMVMTSDGSHGVCENRYGNEWVSGKNMYTWRTGHEYQGYIAMNSIYGSTDYRCICGN